MKFPTLDLNKFFSSQDTLQGIFSVFGDFGISKKILDGDTIEVESGGNFMKYWLTYNLRTAKTNKLNKSNYGSIFSSKKDFYDYIHLRL